MQVAEKWAAELAIHGMHGPAFQEVRDEYGRSFTERGDVGASVCVTVDGETVVDLWAGWPTATARASTGSGCGNLSGSSQQAD